MEVTSIRLFLLCTKLTKLVDVTGDVRELVRTRIAPPGGRHQRHLVVCTQNSSGITCTHLSGRFGQIDYHYKLQDSTKMCASVLKCPPDLPLGALPPGPPLGALPPGPVIDLCAWQTHC